MTTYTNHYHQLCSSAKLFSSFSLLAQNSRQNGRWASEENGGQKHDSK